MNRGPTPAPGGRGLDLMPGREPIAAASNFNGGRIVSKRSRIKAGIMVAVALLIAATVVTVVYLRLRPVNPRARKSAFVVRGPALRRDGLGVLLGRRRAGRRRAGSRAYEPDPRDGAFSRGARRLGRSRAARPALRAITMRRRGKSSRRETLAPESGAIEGLLGLLASRRGQYAEAVSHFRRAVTLNPDDLKSRLFPDPRGRASGRAHPATPKHSRWRASSSPKRRRTSSCCSSGRGWPSSAVTAEP